MNKFIAEFIGTYIFVLFVLIITIIAYYTFEKIKYFI